MNKGMLTVGIIFLSLMALLLVNIFGQVQSGSELDYYLVKETTDAAMIDAIDMEYYRTCGMHRLDKEKFVESFLYRFANSVDATREYDIKFYDINEVPPKVSVKINSLTTLSFKSKDANGDIRKEAADITTNYDAIFETKNYANPTVEFELKDKNSDLCKAYSYSNN